MKRTQRKAAALRRKLGLHGRVDAESVADILGLEVVTWPMEVQQELQMGRFIGVAERLDARWRRWVIAHAIGHRLLHTGKPPVDTRPHEPRRPVRAGGRGLRPRPADGRGRGYGRGPERAVGGGGALRGAGRDGHSSGAHEDGMNGGVAVRQHGVAAYWRTTSVTSPRHQKIRELARPATEGRGNRPRVDSVYQTEQTT